MDLERPVRFGAVVGTSLCALVLFGGCGGGGGGSPAVGFSFESSAGTLSESAGATALEVVLHTSLPALEEDATFEVVDAGTGTATSGADYTAFAPQTITFPAGSLDGASQTVVLEPLDDALVESASETVRLRLQNPSGGSVVGPAQFTATLTDIHTAYLAFATASASTPDEASGAQAVALELDCGSGVTLGVPVSVRVYDRRTGSAVPSADYSAFSTQTITFAAASNDGDVLTVNVQVLDDTALENDETVELGLVSPSATCTLGTIVTHVLTIEDDDLAGNPFFVASEGATGTENPLAYDELLSLGTQAVGAGPNAGTLVRVSNGGGTPMDLGAPSLTGTHPNDFAVEIESSSLPSGGATSGLAAAGAPAPLVAVPDGGPGTALAIDPAALAELSGRSEVALRGIELPGAGVATLELVRRPLPIAPDAKLAIDGVEVAGGVRTLAGDLQLWSGAVAGLQGSRAFLALTPGSAQGFIELPGSDRIVHVVSEGPGRIRLVGEPELLALGFAPPADFCAGQLVPPGAAAKLGLAAEPPTAALTISNCRLALETDWQFYDIFDSSVLLTNYVTGLIGAISDQYRTDVQATLSIAYLGIHTTSNDGWSTQETAGADAGDLLNEFQADWGTNWPAQADLAHFLSGDDLGGGIAYVDALCSLGFGFGVSANLSGNINWLTWTGAPGNFTWDFVVVAHEIGHNFGSWHTHDYCPPLDHCYSNCDGTTSCPRGTLMSYCHTCAGGGGLANIDLYFHPVTANIMRQNANASCLDDAALLPGDFVQYRVQFNPLTATGARSANLEFAHDDPNATQPFRARLSGTAN
jgi:hypothetical protein